MSYKFKLLIGFSLAFLFMSVSLPVEAMDGQMAEQKQKGTSRKMEDKKSGQEQRDTQNKLKVRSLSLLTSVRKKPVPSPKEPLLASTGPSEPEKLKTEIKFLRGQKEHEAFFEKAIMNAKREVCISSCDVSEKFIKEKFIPWFNEVENKLKVTIYLTQKGKNTFKKAEAFNEQKLDSKHTIRKRTIQVCDTNVLHVDQNLFVTATYPWLSPLESEEERLYQALAIIGERAKKLTRKSRKDFVKAGNISLQIRKEALEVAGNRKRESLELAESLEPGAIGEPEVPPSKYSELSLGASEIIKGLEEEKARAAASASGETKPQLINDKYDEEATDVDDLSAIIGESESEEESTSSDDEGIRELNTKNDTENKK